MRQRWTTTSGWAVEHRTDGNRPAYHVTGRGGVYVGVCYSLAELEAFLAAQGVDLADLVEVEPDA